MFGIYPSRQERFGGRLHDHTLVSESLVNAALTTVQIHGGHGYMTEIEVERALHDDRRHDLFRHIRDAAHIIGRWLGL